MEKNSKRTSLKHSFLNLKRNFTTPTENKILIKITAMNDHRLHVLWTTKIKEKSHLQHLKQWVKAPTLDSYPPMFQR
jgi:hypothetical protein